MDKGDDYSDIRELVKNYGYTAHIRSRGDENIKISGFRARRWVIERTHSWLNRFRRLLIRWEKKTELPCYATFCMHMDNVKSIRTFRIGSKLTY